MQPVLRHALSHVVAVVEAVGDLVVLEGMGIDQGSRVVPVGAAIPVHLDLPAVVVVPLVFTLAVVGHGISRVPAEGSDSPDYWSW
jgi:hypothetical protein